METPTGPAGGTGALPLGAVSETGAGGCGAGACGAAGSATAAPVTVHERSAGVGSGVASGPSPRTAKVWSPAVTVTSCGEVHGAHGPASRRHSKRAPSRLAS